MPPFVGFLGKFLLFLNIIKSQDFTVTVFLILIASISTFYYLRVLKLIFFEVQISKKSNQLFQGNFLYVYQDFSISLICFVVILLLALFFWPTHLFIVSKHISIGFFKI